MALITNAIKGTQDTLPKESYKIQYVESAVRETAEKWGINISLVRRYCQQGRIPGAVQKKDGWHQPDTRQLSRATPARSSA